MRARVTYTPDHADVVSDPTPITVNIGEEQQDEGQIIVVDQDGNVLCQQSLDDTNSQIQGAPVFVTSNFDNLEAPAYDYDVVLGANPVDFATAGPEETVVTMTGYGCTEYVPDEVEVQGVLTILASTVGNYPGVVYGPSYANGFFNFEDSDGTYSQITFDNVTNAGDCDGNFGFLQVVNSSTRSATLSDGSVQYIANFSNSALDDHDGSAISPILPSVAPGATVEVTLPDAPGFRVVPQWKLADGTIVDIQSFQLDDVFTAYLMYQSTNPGGQWVPLASVGWACAGKLDVVRQGGRTRYQVDGSATQKTNPSNGIPFPAFPQWNGRAQDNVLATIVGNYYQAKQGQTESVRYRQVAAGPAPGAGQFPSPVET